MRVSDRDGAQAQEQAHAQAAWIEQLQQRMVHLEMENRELRRQLDELRRGVGIAVLIQGRAVALSALPPVPAGPAHSTGMPATPMPSMPTMQPMTPVAPRSGVTGQHPVFTPSRGPASFAPASMPTSAPFAAGPRERVPNNGPRSYAPESGPQSLYPDYGSRTGPVPDDHWLTGRRAAVQPPHQPYPSPAAQPRPQSPSQWVTPNWLREPSPASPGPAAPAAPPAPAQPVRRGTTGQHPSIEQPARTRSTNAARPLRPQFEPADVPSLAQLTGRQAAVRRGSKRVDGESSPFADSFVLD